MIAVIRKEQIPKKKELRVQVAEICAVQVSCDLFEYHRSLVAKARDLFFRSAPELRFSAMRLQPEIFFWHEHFIPIACHTLEV